MGQNIRKADQQNTKRQKDKNEVINRTQQACGGDEEWRNKLRRRRMKKEQDKVNNADSAFIFLISRNQWSVGQGREDNLVFARKIARMILI